MPLRTFNLLLKTALTSDAPIQELLFLVLSNCNKKPPPDIMYLQEGNQHQLCTDTILEHYRPHSLH